MPLKIGLEVAVEMKQQTPQAQNGDQLVKLSPFSRVVPPSGHLADGRRVEEPAFGPEGVHAPL